MTERSQAVSDLRIFQARSPRPAALDASLRPSQAADSSVPESPRLRVFRACATASAIGAALIGLLVLYGWTFKIEALKSVVNGLVAMKANTAIGLAVCGAALALSIPADRSLERRRLARLLALLAVIIGAASLIEIVLRIDLRIDQLLFTERADAIATSSPGRMAPTAAAGFMAIGLAVLLLDRETQRRHREGQLLGLGVALVAMISIVGYIYGAPILYGVFLGPKSPMALHTALGLMLLSGAVLLARPQSGFVAVFAGEAPGSVMARRFLPAVLGVPIVLGWLCLQGQYAGLYTIESGLALYAGANIVVFLVLVWLNAGTLNLEFDQRSRAESQLRELNAELEAHVAERTRRLEHQGEQLRQAQKMEAIGNLTGGMAHDFNNLLGVIIGNLDLLSANSAADPQSEELLREAVEAALRGADLIQRLLAFARRQPLRPELIDVGALVARIGKLLGRTLGESIEITLDLKEDVWRVVADSAQLEASLVNIANNARDAMPEGGALIIATSNRRLDVDYTSQYPSLAPGDYALIEMSDTGEGIKPELVARIFEPFFTTKEQGKGTGLGLSMVFGFMKQSGGHVSVYSELGVGTTFRLFLPRAIADAVMPDAPPVADSECGGHESILIVEDDASLRRVAARQLKELGYRLFEAPDGPSALRILESEAVDLIFTDVVMAGGMSGYDVARTALSRWPTTRILLTSGFPEAKLNANRGEAPNLPLLIKPYRKADLARMLRETLEG